MSESSDLPSAAESIRESVTGAIDADELESMLESDGSLRSAGRDLGGKLGGELGAILGRELGVVVATGARKREDPRTMLSNVARRLVELLGALLRNADIESGVSRLVEFGTGVVSGETSGELLGDVVPGEADESDGDGDGDNGDSGGESQASEGGSDAEKGDDGAASDDETTTELSADTLGEMREETYRELLGVMSYRELQSIAKDIGVKANLSQEEMIERIVEEFSEDRAGSEDADG